MLPLLNGTIVTVDTWKIVVLIHRRISLSQCQLDLLRATLPVDLNLDLLADLLIQRAHGQRCSMARH